jgi:hypothetical protein
MNKYRILIATALFSVSLACFVFAKPKLTDAQKVQIGLDCLADATYWKNNCINNIPPNSTNRQADEYQCTKGAADVDYECLQRNGVADARANAGDDPGTPLPKKGDPNLTPTPRPGPAEYRGCPKVIPHRRRERALAEYRGCRKVIPARRLLLADRPC